MSKGAGGDPRHWSTTASTCGCWLDSSLIPGCAAQLDPSDIVQLQMGRTTVSVTGLLYRGMKLLREVMGESR